MRKIKSLLLVLGLLLGTTGIYAENGHVEQSKTLSLHDAILLAVRNNPSVRSAKLQRVIDKYRLEVARNEFEPQFAFSASGEVREGRQPNYNINPSMSMKTPIGTKFDFSVTDDIDHGHNSSRFTASMRQPLLRGFGRHVTTAKWLSAQDQEIANKLSFKEHVQTTITSVLSSYYKLVEDYNRLQVNQLALKDSMQSLKSTRMKIKAGKLAPMESTQQEAQVSDQRFAITQTKNAIDTDYQDLLTQLGLDPDSKLSIEHDIPVEKIVIPELIKSIEIALKNNIAFTQKKLSLKAKERNVDVQKDNQRWQLDLVGSINKNLTGAREVDSAGNSSLIGNKRAALELKIPIDDVAAKEQLVSAKIGLKQFHIALANEKRKLTKDVVNGIRDLEAQQRQIYTADRSVSLAKKSLDIAQKKFKYGRVTVFEITTLRKNLTEKKLQLIKQRINYLNTMARFEQTLGVTLDKWHLTFYDK